MQTISIISIVIPLLKVEVGKDMIFTLTRGHLMLSKSKGYTWYLDTIQLSNSNILVNIYKY